MLRRWRTRKIATMIASPTATSAAATAMTNSTRVCPSGLPQRWLKAQKKCDDSRAARLQAAIAHGESPPPRDERARNAPQVARL